MDPKIYFGMSPADRVRAEVFRLAQQRDQALGEAYDLENPDPVYLQDPEKHLRAVLKLGSEALIPSRVKGEKRRKALANMELLVSTQEELRGFSDRYVQYEYGDELAELKRIKSQEKVTKQESSIQEFFEDQVEREKKGLPKLSYLKLLSNASQRFFFSSDLVTGRMFPPAVFDVCQRYNVRFFPVKIGTENPLVPNHVVAYFPDENILYDSNMGAERKKLHPSSTPGNPVTNFMNYKARVLKPLPQYNPGVIFSVEPQLVPNIYGPGARYIPLNKNFAIGNGACFLFCCFMALAYGEFKETETIEMVEASDLKKLEDAQRMSVGKPVVQRTLTDSVKIVNDRKRTIFRKMNDLANDVVLDDIEDVFPIDRALEMLDVFLKEEDIDKL